MTRDLAPRRNVGLWPRTACSLIVAVRPNAAISGAPKAVVAVVQKQPSARYAGRRRRAGRDSVALIEGGKGDRPMIGLNGTRSASAPMRHATRILRETWPLLSQ